MRCAVFRLVAFVAMLILVKAISASANSYFAYCDVNSVKVISNSQDIAGPVYPNILEDNYMAVQLAQPLPSNTITLQATIDAPSFLWDHDTLEWFYNGTLVERVNPNLPDSPLQHDFLVSQRCGITNILSLRLSRYLFFSANNYNYCNHTYSLALANPACHVSGDPQFVGLLGQSFQVHGIDGAVYSLISAPNFLVNARFEFLTGPRDCPAMPSTGLKSQSCWTHPGSYLGAVGVRTASGDVLIVESGAAAEGFSSVQLNGKSLSKKVSVEFANMMGSVSLNSTHELTISVGMLSLEIENVDSFVNLRSVQVSANGWAQLAADRVHGLLGQTWQSRRYAGIVKAIEGDVDDYVIGNDELTGAQFVFNRFMAA